MRGKGLGVRGIGHCGCAMPLSCCLCPSACLTLSYRQQTPLAPPQDVRVFDTPSDGGGSLTVLWSPAAYDSAAAKYQVLLSEGATVSDPAAMKVVAEFPVEPALRS